MTIFKKKQKADGGTKELKLIIAQGEIIIEKLETIHQMVTDTKNQESKEDLDLEQRRRADN